MNDASSIAQSGMTAFSTKLEVTANNIANVASDNFQPARVVMQERQDGGVTATATKAADQVDISREAVELLSTVNGFRANLQVQKTGNEMTKSMLDIIS